MMELTAFVILIISLVGIAVIMLRKIPALLAIPEADPTYFHWLEFFRKIKIINPLKGLSFEILLQKVLSRVRILSLRTENKTSNWLKKIRTKAKIRKNLDAHYWEEIKRSAKDE